MTRTCIGCGGEVSSKNRSGYCVKTPECRSANVSLGNRVRKDPDRTCLQCAGPISAANRTDYCRGNAECTDASRRQKDRAMLARRKGLITPEQFSSLPVRELHDLVLQVLGPVSPTFGKRKPRLARLKDDGYIDEVAIYLTVEGIRRVPMTDPERIEAVRVMLAMGLGSREIGARAGVANETIAAIRAGKVPGASAGLKLSA